ncbi:MAG: M20 family metallopeptidase [Spirochaetia bacterium]|jgi:amidohydrolase|nr:M20 family metallopeptidase [Spirochaetia bacterium]
MKPVINLEKTIQHRRALHAIPEVGLELPRTVAYIRSALAAAGIQARDCAGGLLADLGDSGPLIAIRADMDGLPVREETGAEYASGIDGCMHACGHDGHSAALLAIAEHLSKHPPQDHRIRLVFQPGEEGFFGARHMMAAGCLDGVSAITGGHLGDLSEELAPGQAGFMAGKMMAASDIFEGSFTGSGGHGSAPHKAVDPIPALAQFVLGLQNFRARVPDQRQPFVLSVCQMSAGSAFNIIPGTAGFKGTARTLGSAERSLAQEGIKTVGTGVALATGTSFDLQWTDGYPALVNNPAATAVATKAAEAVLGPERVRTMSLASMGGEDFAYYLEKLPGCFWFMNTQAPGRNIRFPNHHPRFDLDESFLGDFAAVNLGIAQALAARVLAGAIPDTTDA